MTPVFVVTLGDIIGLIVAALVVLALIVAALWDWVARAIKRRQERRFRGRNWPKGYLWGETEGLGCYFTREGWGPGANVYHTPPWTPAECQRAAWEHSEWSGRNR